MQVVSWLKFPCLIRWLNSGAVRSDLSERAAFLAEMSKLASVEQPGGLVLGSPAAGKHGSVSPGFHASSDARTVAERYIVITNTAIICKIV